MEGNSSEEYGNGGVSSPREGISDGQRCQSVDSLAEWRSSEQVENGTPSTSPPFWDTEDDDDDCGPRPSELYGKFTWKIENFSQINKRELRSNAFEVGSYKWYILIYPQGCDVCNHLSLFLCVANHDKLLPGWSHFAQFTIAVVNKDPKKTKYSDTLHRFWKKEHDWGWKKFMELSKVLDGFINNDTLVIKAQVQVIREKANYLFRCLDCQYRREVLRVYLSNVEQICRTFFEERKKKLCDLIGDKIRWSSFCTFWLEIDQNSRRRMSKEKSDTILRVVVKHFFVEKEVTSTLVMDSLYSGLKALECQSKNKKERLKIEMDAPAPMVRVDKDMFVLSDDVLLLLERVASDPLPTISSPPKDDKVSQNRTKEGSSGEEFNKDSIERDERRLTELGRRTVEIFVLAHIFSSRIEVAYQEAVALKRQEELIREEEAAGQAETELKAKRAAAEKEKRTKKKQAKQKRNNRKNKDKQRDLKTDLVLNEKYQEENSLDAMTSGELSAKQGHLMNKRFDAQENAYDVSCTGDDVIESHYLDLEDRASSPLNWGMDASEVHPIMEASACEIPNGRSEKMSPVLDDSSSTCSTDSVPSFVSNGPCKGNSVILSKSHTLPNRVNTHSRKDSQNHPSVGRHSGEVLDSCMSICPELEADVVSLKHPIQSSERHLVEKQEATGTINKKTIKDPGVAERLSSTRILESFSASPGPGRKMQPFLLQAKQPVQSSKIATNAATVSIAVPALIKEPPTSSFTFPKRASLSAKLLQSSTSQSEAQKLAAAPPAKDTAAQPFNAISRPSSAPLIPAVPKTNTPVISTVQVMPHLSRSVSAAGRFPMDPSSSAPSYGPQSYRNAIIGKNTLGSSPTGFTYSVSSSLSQASTSSSHSSTTSTFSASMLPPPSSTIKEDRQQMASRPGFTFGSVKPEALHIQKQQRDDSIHNTPTSSSACTASTTTRSGLYQSNIANDIERPDICPEQRTKHYQGESLSSTLLSHGGAVDEFPHMDIINDLLDEEQSIMEKAVSISSQYHTQHQHHRSFSRQYSFPVDVISNELGSISNSTGRFDQIDHYCNDGLQSLNGSSFGGGLHRLRDDHLAQVDLSAAYASGQMDGLIQGQWPYSHSDLSIMNLSSTDGSGYTYQHLSDYANLGTRPNGYGLYRP